jgi:hypothetical protein
MPATVIFMRQNAQSTGVHSFEFGSFMLYDAAEQNNTSQKLTYLPKEVPCCGGAYCIKLLPKLRAAA